MRLILALAGVGLIAGCAPMAETPPVQAGPQRCDADSAKSLIGSHMGAVDFAAGANVRFVCTTCASTRDYRPDRLNIRFEEATGIIRSIDCG